MSQARVAWPKGDDGRFTVSCEPCDAEGTFPDIVTAIKARRAHICQDEALSCAEWS